MGEGHMGDRHNMDELLALNSEKRIALVKNIKKI